MSTIVVRLTSQQPPINLVSVHIRVVIEGIESRQVLGAQPSLTYTFNWDRHNAFKQKVYGLATAVGTFGVPYFRSQSTAQV